MKFRIFLFLVLFFSSFSVLAILENRDKLVEFCSAPPPAGILSEPQYQNLNCYWNMAIHGTCYNGTKADACSYGYAVNPCPSGTTRNDEGACVDDCKVGEEYPVPSGLYPPELVPVPNTMDRCHNGCAADYVKTDVDRLITSSGEMYMKTSWFSLNGLKCDETTIPPEPPFFCPPPSVSVGDPMTCSLPPKCDFPLQPDPNDPMKCIPYPDCPHGQERDIHDPNHPCVPCKPPEIPSPGTGCEIPNCPPPGAWNYTTNQCEGSPPPGECQPGYHHDMYGNCVPDNNPNPPSPPQQPPPGEPGHDGHGSGTSTSSNGVTTKFDFDIDLSGIEGMLGDLSDTAANIDKSTANTDFNTKGILDKISDFFDKKSGDGQHSTGDLDAAYDSASSNLLNEVNDKFSSSQLDGYTPDSSHFDSIKNIFPVSSECSDYSLPITLSKYSFTLVLPVCKLYSFKVILEWVIYVLTALYVFNVSLDISMTKG